MATSLDPEYMHRIAAFPGDLAFGAWSHHLASVGDDGLCAAGVPRRTATYFQTRWNGMSILWLLANSTCQSEPVEAVAAAALQDKKYSHSRLKRSSYFL
jgi:hypothetical protein